jgi:hypothetical protein
MSERATLSIDEEELGSLEKLIKGCDYVLKHDIPTDSRKNEIEFYRIMVASVATLY